MNLAIIGYGKMGKTIHQIALEQGHSVRFTIDKNNKYEVEQMNSENVDVAIEFSNPESAFSNITMCIEKGIPIVSGTTGWLDKYDDVVNLCNKKGGAFMYGSNYSIGVNIFFELNRYLAEKMRKYRQYKTQIEEIHHTEKLDAPSGTAITIAEGILANSPTLDTWVNQEGAKENELSIISKREPKVPGTHIVEYESAIDQIEIKHIAHSRMGFAQGAFEAALWLKDRKGVYDIKDMLFGA